MLHLLHIIIQHFIMLVKKGEKMSSKRWIMLGVIIICGFILGRLVFRAFLNLILGGTMFGGNIL